MEKTVPALMCAVIFLSLCAVPVRAVPLKVGFTAVVTEVFIHPPGETWGGRVIPIGTAVTGSYEYEPSPSSSNPYQIINGSFAFAAGALTSAGDFLNIPINRLGEPGYTGGDRYRPWSGRDLGFICGLTACGDTYEAFWVDLETMATILPSNPITTVPDFTLFDRHIFHYQLSNSSGWFRFDATLTSLAFISDPHIPEPTTLAIFTLGLAGLGFVRRRRAA